LRDIEINGKDIEINWRNDGNQEFISTGAQSGFILEPDRKSTKRRRTTSLPKRISINGGFIPQFIFRYAVSKLHMNVY
jgi:hypothetical protein